MKRFNLEGRLSVRLDIDTVKRFRRLANKKSVRPSALLREIIKRELVRVK